MKPIMPGVYMLTGMIVGRVYLIEDADGLTLIDASIPPSASAILKQIASLGRRPGDLKRVLITHAHPDHIGALPAIKQATGAQVIASSVERPVIEGKMPVPRVPREQLSGLLKYMRPPETTPKPTPVDREVNGGEVLAEVMGGLHVVSTPGHAPGHVSFWQPDKRLLFCGDVIFNAPSLRLPFSILTVDMKTNIQSVGRLAELDASTICFGHGQPMTQNTAQRIREFARKVGAM